MSEQGKRIMDVNIQTSVDPTDTVIVVYNAANTTTAQTSQITVQNLFANIISSGFALTDIRADPIHSTSLAIAGGQVFVSNNFLYIATSNNFIKRVALAEF